MSIVIIEGPSQSGKTLIANAMRNNQIAQKFGALLVDEQQDGDAHPLIEKILVGASIPAEPPADLSALPWKPNSMVILVGDKQAMLEEFEALLPGFVEFMGPVYTIETGKS